MKATQRNFAADATRLARQCRIFYFCGADEAGAHDAAARIVELLPADSERVELPGAELKRDPVRLADEARSSSLFGATRYLMVRTAGDEVLEAVETLLQSPVEPCPVLIVASSASDKSRVAKLLADRADSLVAIFHPPDLPAIAAAVRRMGDAAGVRLDTALAERIARGCGLDSRMARAEVDKLALYLDASPQAPRTADPASLDAIVAVSDDDSFLPLVNCVLGGDLKRLPGELARLRELSLSPVGLLLACERRAAQLAALAGRWNGRGQAESFVQSERAAGRVFFRDANDLARQLGCWPGPRMTRLVARLTALHGALLRDSANAELLLVHGLGDIARAAAKR